MDEKKHKPIRTMFNQNIKWRKKLGKDRWNDRINGYIVCIETIELSVKSWFEMFQWGLSHQLGIHERYIERKRTMRIVARACDARARQWRWYYISTVIAVNYTLTTLVTACDLLFSQRDKRKPNINSLSLSSLVVEVHASTKRQLVMLAQ